MRKFQEMCQEEFGKIELMARGGQKIVFDGVHNSYGETVIKLYFQLNDPRSIREIQIEKGLSLSMVPKIYETGIIEYEGTETDESKEIQQIPHISPADGHNYAGREQDPHRYHKTLQNPTKIKKTLNI